MYQPVTVASRRLIRGKIKGYCRELAGGTTNAGWFEGRSSAAGTVCLEDGDSGREKKRDLPRMRRDMTMTKHAGSAIIILKSAVS